MERPMCPLCKTKHYAREPHAFKEQVQTSPEPERKSEKDVAAKTSSSGSFKEVDGLVRTGFDRKAYQRRYMRHWRALESTWRAVESGRACWLKTSAGQVGQIVRSARTSSLPLTPVPADPV